MVKKRSVNILQKRGFSLVEVIVVSGMIVVLFSIVLMRRDDFEKTVHLKNIAYEIALTMRSAQMMGSNGRVPVGGDGPVPYGIYILTGFPEVNVYADTNANLSYDPGEPIIEQYSLLSQRAVIDRFCVTDQSGHSLCNDFSGIKYMALDIVFTRPSPTPYFRAYRSPGVYVGSSYKKAEVFFRSQDGAEESVVIDSQGLIYVEE